MGVADGSFHEVRMTTIDSVRVGKFTVQNVKCAVQPKEKPDAPSLLGNSFLNKFTYKFNPGAETVTFSQIRAAESTPAKAVRKGKTVAPARRGRTSRPPSAPAVGKDSTPSAAKDSGRAAEVRCGTEI